MNNKNNYPELKDINEKMYDWSINVLRSVLNMLKVNVKLHTDQQVIKGDIFLCNHFSRFETMIPQYLIYEETGAYSCAIASSEFFKQGSVMAEYLNNIGVIPHNHKNLFSNLARQVFLGRKIIIFPEGGMVKDHRVIDDKGNYSIFSRITGKRRKQHTGAAVLAQGIEAFKAIIRNAYTNKNYDLLMQWKVELKLDSLEQLLTTALRPTLIVPTNITFYPIRSSENLLFKGVEMLSDGLSARQTEELLVEGNLLFKDTDMDVRMGKLVDPHDVWLGCNQYLLRLVSSELNSLDDVFSLYSSPQNLKQKLLGFYFRINAKATRNQYMQEIYANLTINLSHLASTLIIYCMEQGLQQINKKCFYKTLYIAVKLLQTNKKVNLHRSLLNPDEYNDLIEGKSKRFEHFIRLAESSGLIASYQDKYQFLPKLYEEFDFDTIRMENLITVYDNEVKPIGAVIDTILKAHKQCEKTKQEQWATWAFNDEIISLAWDKARYSKACYDDINKQETALEDAKPFLLKPKTNNGFGIILIHGLLASPAELRTYGEYLVAQGYTILGVRLKGHGTSPHDLRQQTYEDWFDSVSRGLKLIKNYSNKIVLIGFSTGGALALKMAAQNKKQIVAVVAVSVPITYAKKSFLFVPLLHGANQLVNWLTSMEGMKTFVENNQENKEINYKNVPVKCLYELRRLTNNVEELLSEITIPTLIIYADKDPVVNPDSAQTIFDKLKTYHKKLVGIDSNYHGILMKNKGGTWDSIQVFLKKYVVVE